MKKTVLLSINLLKENSQHEAEPPRSWKWVLWESSGERLTVDRGGLGGFMEEVGSQRKGWLIKEGGGVRHQPRRSSYIRRVTSFLLTWNTGPSLSSSLPLLSYTFSSFPTLLP